MAYLTLSHISKQFGDTYAVEDFNLDIEKGEFVSFLGPSGCGKTTTLRMVAGFEIPTAGNITLGGKDITDKAPNQRNVGMIFQAYALFPNMTGRNVRLVWTLDGPFATADYSYRLTSPHVQFDDTGFDDLRAEGRGR